MRSPVSDGLLALVREGMEVDRTSLLDRWEKKTVAFLRAAMGPDATAEFTRISIPDSWEMHAARLGHLEGLIARVESLAAWSGSADEGPAPGNNPSPPGHAPQVNGSRRVFLVHGHDVATKEKTARFLEKLGLEPIVLHEQPNSGRTIIEKFETYSGDIAFAIVLLTPDDPVGAADSDVHAARARQNVILELGYFMGRLGRSRVCALFKEGVTLPSDYQGILYVPLDEAGAWKNKLAQELVHAKLPIDLTALLGG